MGAEHTVTFGDTSTDEAKAREEALWQYDENDDYCGQCGNAGSGNALGCTSNCPSITAE